ncbi:unnamed protein product [Anisakis simplex]|uniref:Hemagglutinin/amebocyte aggregation factor n=1 Tax=Anisakis simplex TaxID=6269 RepID=A0A0M3K9N1_ANISI|nr:unnamed protein product [Anisakis simplex]
MKEIRSQNLFSLIAFASLIPFSILTLCPVSDNIPPPICAFLFDTTDCSGSFHPVREDSEEWNIDEIWNDRIQMAIIRPDCYLDVFDGVNLTDSHRYLGGGTSEDNVYRLSWYSFANRTSSYYCQCNP